MKTKNQGFVCQNCKNIVLPLNNGGYRNHCSYCLFSLHLDNVPGDRLSTCKSLMEPVGIIYNSKKGYQIIHTCKKCKKNKLNVIACDDSIDEICSLFNKNHL